MQRRPHPTPPPLGSCPRSDFLSLRGGGGWNARWWDCGQKRVVVSRSVSSHQLKVRAFLSPGPLVWWFSLPVTYINNCFLGNDGILPLHFVCLCHTNVLFPLIIGTAYKLVKYLPRSRNPLYRCVTLSTRCLLKWVWWMDEEEGKIHVLGVLWKVPLSGGFLTLTLSSEGFGRSVDSEVHICSKRNLTEHFTAWI